MTEERNRLRMVAAFVGFVAVLGAALFSLLLRIDLMTSEAEVNWLAFALFSTLLFLGETQPRF